MHRREAIEVAGDGLAIGIQGLGRDLGIEMHLDRRDMIGVIRLGDLGRADPLELRLEFVEIVSDNRFYLK